MSVPHRHPSTRPTSRRSDSVQSYNGLNLHLNHRLTQGVTFDAIYTYSKSLDQVSNGDSADSNANQTDPAHNNTEYGPSDYDVRHRVTLSGLWDLPTVKDGNALLKAVANGWQMNGLYTYHTGFPFTPVTYQLHGIPTLATAGTIGPVRPLAYYGGLSTSCNNALYRNGIRSGQHHQRARSLSGSLQIFRHHPAPERRRHASRHRPKLVPRSLLYRHRHELRQRTKLRNHGTQRVAPFPGQLLQHLQPGNTHAVLPTATATPGR